MTLISLRAVEQCDKNCSYCDYNEITYKKLNYELFPNQLQMTSDFINKNKFDYSITGGETGLIDKSMFEMIFNSIQRKSIIATNGLFIRKNYDELYDEYIKEIYYHCVEEITSDVIVKKFDNPKIKYLIVVHANNINQLSDFLKNNEHINFDIKLIERRAEKIPPLLGINDLYHLMKIVSTHPNINSNIISNLSTFISLIEDDKINNIRMNCSRRCFTPQIDFVHNVIRKCYKSYTKFPTIELTRENLISVMKYKIKKFHISNDICNSCTYIYNFKHINSITMTRHTISRKIK